MQGPARGGEYFFPTIGLARPSTQSAGQRVARSRPNHFEEKTCPGIP